MRCPNCGGGFPGGAILPLSFGTRTYRCKACGVLCRMNPYKYMRWSLIPLLLMAACLLLVAAKLFWAFLIALLVIRIVWVFAAPRVVPIECLKPPPLKS